MHPRSSARPLLVMSCALVFAAYAAGAAVSADPEPAAPPLTTTGKPVVAGGKAGPAGEAGDDPVARGRFLVDVLGCAACHTPKGPDGKPLAGFAFAGHRAGDPYAAWSDSLWDRGVGMIVSPSGTAFAGPWGVTFGRNLTPDPTTGIGGWNAEAFIYILREGTLKPPMPNLAYGNLSDEDLGAIFAYLQSLPPVKNLVPFRELSPPRLPGETPGTRATSAGAK